MEKEACKCAKKDIGSLKSCKQADIGDKENKPQVLLPAGTLIGGQEEVVR